MNAAASGSGTFGRDWIYQYKRMLRSFNNLPGVRPKTNVFDAGEIEDSFMHFYQDAYHLKDWLVSDIENHITNDQNLSLAADLANGTKHGKLSSTRTGDISTNMLELSFSGPVDGLEAKITVKSAANNIDGVKLAKDIVASWDSYLQAKGLQV